MSWPVGQSAWLEYIMGHYMKFCSTCIPDEALNCMYHIQIFISWVTLYKRLHPICTQGMDCIMKVDAEIRLCHI